MKKFLCFCICAFMLCCTACNSQGSAEEVTGRGRVFEAVVKEVGEDRILVMPDAAFDEANVALNIGLVVIKSANIPEVKEGDRVRIDYDGTSTRSIPAQLGEIYSFEIIG